MCTTCSVFSNNYENGIGKCEALVTPWLIHSFIHCIRTQDINVLFFLSILRICNLYVTHLHAPFYLVYSHVLLYNSFLEPIERLITFLDGCSLFDLYYCQQRYFIRFRRDNEENAQKNVKFLTMKKEMIMLSDKIYVWWRRVLAFLWVCFCQTFCEMSLNANMNVNDPINIVKILYSWKYDYKICIIICAGSVCIIWI